MVDSLNKNSESIKSKVLWEHERRASGVTLVIILAIAGLVVISLTSFGLFFKWSGNFIRINGRTGNSGLDIIAVISVITPPTGLLLEVIGNAWIWYNYEQLGFPLTSYKSGIAAVFIVFSILSLLILCFSCYMNILRSKYPANLIDLQFSTETLTYCLTLCLVQLPTNFVAYFYLAKFKTPSQFMPSSLVVKPIFMLIVWLTYILTTTGNLSLILPIYSFFSQTTPIYHAAEQCLLSSARGFLASANIALSPNHISITAGFDYFVGH